MLMPFYVNRRCYERHRGIIPVEPSGVKYRITCRTTYSEHMSAMRASSLMADLYRTQ